MHSSYSPCVSKACCRPKVYSVVPIVSLSLGFQLPRDFLYLPAGPLIAWEPIRTPPFLSTHLSKPKCETDICEQTWAFTLYVVIKFGSPQLLLPNEVCFHKVDLASCTWEGVRLWNISIQNWVQLTRFHIKHCSHLSSKLKEAQWIERNIYMFTTME